MSKTPTSVADLFAAYIDNVKAEALSLPVDEALMREIEVELDVPQSRKEDFRRSLLNHIRGLALEGRSFGPDTNPRLYAALQRVTGSAGSASPSESLAERGLRLLREGANGVGSITITAGGVSRPVDDAVRLAEARRCLDTALTAGDTRAEKPLAIMLREGMGGPVDAARARLLYRQVVKRSGDSEAQISLAIMTATGEGGVADRGAAYRQLRPFAARGHLRAVAALLDIAEGPDELREAEHFAAEARQHVRGE